MPDGGICREGVQGVGQGDVGGVPVYNQQTDGVFEMSNAEKLVGVIILALIIVLFIGAGFGSWHRETVRMPEVYALWVKATGNPKGLTYQEWRKLLECNSRIFLSNGGY